MHYKRQADGLWLYEEVAGIEATLRSVSLHCEVPLSRIYRNVDFAAAERNAYLLVVE